jgi:hypothetical protein
VTLFQGADGRDEARLREAGSGRFGFLVGPPAAVSSGLQRRLVPGHFFPADKVAATLGIHSLIGIFCGHFSSQALQATQALARSPSAMKRM